jgi:hypothetical protein
VGGCTNCKAKPGCDDHKGSMFAALDDTLARLYPTRTWGVIADHAIDGVPFDDVAAIADELARELDAATFVRPGDEHEPCDHIYVLAIGRPPCAIQVRDFGVAPPTEWALGPIRELYLKLSLSQLARVAAVQQVAIDVDFIGEGAAGTSAPTSDETARSCGLGGEYAIIERPRAGVYDAPLLGRMQRLVAILPAYDLVHLDFGDISAPPSGYAAGDWPARYGGPAPATAGYLFSPEPATSVRTVVVARARG